MRKLSEKKLSLKELKARAIIAADLFRGGKITRVECFRIEMDASLGENTGDIKYEDNNDFLNNEM